MRLVNPVCLSLVEKEIHMKTLLPALLASALFVASVSAATPAATTVKAILAQPVDKAVVTFKAAVVEDQGKNKFLVADAGQRIEVKAGPDWHHTVSLPLKQPLTFTGEVHAKDKDGQRKIKVELYKVTRADGAAIRIRDADAKPWDGKDKHSGKPPIKLDWKKP
jgi:uncharacterized protein YdeI (BOF family)